MSDFTRISNHNPHANFKNVRIGADAPVLEVELNELQDISAQRMIDLINNYIGNGINGDSSFVYNPDTNMLKVTGGKAIVDGYTVNITTLSLTLNEGEEAYLKVWEQVVSFNDTIPYEGNVQETSIIPNTLVDDRIGRETSRRTQIQYDLVKERTDENAHYLRLGLVSDSKFIVVAHFKSKEQRMYTYHTVPQEGQTTITLEQPYQVNTNALLVFVDGVLQYTGVNYQEINNSQIQFNSLFTGEEEVYVHYQKLCVATRQEKVHGHQHAKDGSDPLDIKDLADSTGIYNKIKSRLDFHTVDGGDFLDDIETDDYIDGGYF